VIVLGALATPLATPLLAQGATTAPAPGGSGEASLVIPDLSQVSFLGVNGHTLLLSGLVVCALGLLFGLTIYTRLKNMAVHVSMRDISELIYET
jgi:K(+)-stimulated pyrophosphate-energized sodium pump